MPKCASQTAQSHAVLKSQAVEELMRKKESKQDRKAPVTCATEQSLCMEHSVAAMLGSQNVTHEGTTSLTWKSVVHAWNLNLGVVRQEDQELKANLVWPCPESRKALV